MDKEQIDLKRSLTNEDKDVLYAPFVPNIGFYQYYWEKTELKTLDEILSNIQTDAALAHLNNLIAEYALYLVNQNIDFSFISINISENLYATEHSLEKLKKFGKIKGLIKTDILQDIIGLCFCWKAYKIENEIGEYSLVDTMGMISDEYYDLKYFVVKCDEFIKKVEKLGYDISYKKFEEKVNLLCDNPQQYLDDCEIKISYNMEKNNNGHQKVKRL